MRHSARDAMRWLLSALVAAGASIGGGMPAAEPPSDLSPAPARAPGNSRPSRLSQQQVEREAARGIVELERFLERESHV